MRSKSVGVAAMTVSARLSTACPSRLLAQRCQRGRWRARDRADRPRTCCGRRARCASPRASRGPSGTGSPTRPGRSARRGSRSSGRADRRRTRDARRPATARRPAAAIGPSSGTTGSDEPRRRVRPPVDRRASRVTASARRSASRRPRSTRGSGGRPRTASRSRRCRSLSGTTVAGLQRLGIRQRRPARAVEHALGDEVRRAVGSRRRTG